MDQYLFALYGMAVFGQEQCKMTKLFFTGHIVDTINSNDAYMPGIISVDADTKSITIYDGKTVGGITLITNGKDGVNGRDGIPGMTGAKGDTGATGSPGIQGLKGYTGSTGITGTAGYTGDNGPAITATVRAPTGIAVDASANVFFVDNGNNVIRKIDAGTGIITTIAGFKAAVAGMDELQNKSFDIASVQEWQLVNR